MSSGLGAPACGIYLNRIRLFRAHCQSLGLDEDAELTRDGVARFLDAYVGPRKGGPIGTSSRNSVGCAVRAWAYALRALGIEVPAWSPPRAPATLSPLLTAYCKYRRDHRGVVAMTIDAEVEVAKEFLALLRARGRSAAATSVGDIDAYVASLSARFSKKTVACSCSKLRAFLRFLRASGTLRRDLAAMVESPRIRFADRPVRTLPWADVRRLFGKIRRDRRIGKRDFAMLLLMATYGFGAAEVLGLRLQDVDWAASTIRVRRPKTGVAIELPLLSPVGRVLATYLRSGRPPRIAAREIFVQHGMPHRPLTSGAIRHRIREYAGRAGIEAEVLGAHLLRHCHATRQIDGGTNPKIVSDILGHRRPSSTSAYVRAAVGRLRAAALPVPK
ncbi:MAG: tyrosine-type recombinase/integrase [Rhodoglobus sp.]